MKRHPLRMLIAAAAVLSLAACSTTPAGTSTVMFGMSPTNELGYETDGGTITIESRNLQFRNYAGMPVAYITGYRVEYYNAANVRIGQTPAAPQSLNMVVAPGFQCEEPDPVLGCQDGFARWQAPGPVSTTSDMGNQLLPADIAVQHAGAGSPAGWFAILTIYGHNVYGPFEDVHVLNIVAPN